jgi:hypothetical protein
MSFEMVHNMTGQKGDKLENAQNGVKTGVVAVATATKDCSPKTLSEMYQKLGSYAKVGAEVGLSGERVRKIVTKYDSTHAEIDRFVEDKPYTFNAMQKRILDKVDDKKLDKLSASQLVVAAAIIQDKLRDMASPLGGILSGAVRWVDIVHLSMQGRKAELDVTPKEVSGD